MVDINLSQARRRINETIFSQFYSLLAGIKRMKFDSRTTFRITEFVNLEGIFNTLM